MLILERLRPQKYAPRWHTITVYGLYLFAAIAAGLLIVFVLQWRAAVGDGKSLERASAQLRALSAARAMSTQLTEFAVLVTEAASDPAGFPDSGEELEKRLSLFVGRNVSVKRAGVLFEPVGGALFAPFVTRRFDPLDQLARDFGLETFDYTATPDALVTGLDNPDRYLLPRANGSAWGRPYYDADFKTTIGEFGVAFAGVAGGRSGVFYAHISTEALTANLSWNGFRETGYGFLLSSEGVFLEHPSLTRVVGADTVFDEGEDVILRQIAEDVSQGISGIVNYVDEISGGGSWIAYESIEPTGWALGYVVLKDQVVVRTADSLRALMRAAAAIIALVFFVIVVASRAYAGSLGGLWVASLSLSALFIAGLGLTWYLEKDTPEERAPSRLNIETVSTFENSVLDEFNFEPTALAVGVIVETVTFLTVDTVVVTGRVWQGFENLNDSARIRGIETLPLLKPGFIFPRARNVTFTRLYERRQGVAAQYGWTFEAVLTAEFDFGKYPFDRATISLPMEHIDFGRAVISVPDLDSYDNLLADDLPGLRQGLTIVGWNPEVTFFDYNPVNLKNDIGLIEPIGTRTQPELSYNLQMSRQTIGPLISNALPLTIVTALLFAVMMITTKMDEWVLAFAGNVRRADQSIVRTADGTEGGGPSYALIATSIVVAYSGALLFAVILAHARLRGQFPDAGVLYLEFYYFIVYVAIFTVTVNALVFAAHRGGGLVHFRENLLPRVMFWPLITGYGFIITFLTFY